MRAVSPCEVNTPRLRLRPVSSADVGPLFEMRRDDEWAFFGAPQEQTRTHVESSVERAIEEGWTYGPYFVITLNGDVVGDAVLQVDAADETANLGYAVARPLWGGGIATEAARAVVDHGFMAWELAKVHARIDPRNVGSIKVAEAVPMSHEGTLREHHIRRGERVDRALYGVLRREWLALQTT